MLVVPSGSVLDGSSVTLTCTSSGNPAVVNFTWFRVVRREMQMMSSEQNFTFNVTKLSRDQYYCQARNAHGAEYSDPANIDVTCKSCFTFNVLEVFSLVDHAHEANFFLYFSCSRDPVFFPLCQDFSPVPMHL